jgi:hypothetical protein
MGEESMRQFVFANAFLLVAFGVGIAVRMDGSSQRSTDDDDRAVILAILEHTVRPDVARANGSATPVPPLFVFNRTTAICTDVPEFKYPCVQRSVIEALRDGDSPATRAIESDLIRRELIEAFESRNQTSHALPRLGAQRVVMVSSREIAKSGGAKSGGARHEPARGHSYFSRPAYSTQGYALVHGVYDCGFLCGTGRFFVLKKTASGWHVAAAVMLWIS